MKNGRRIFRNFPNVYAHFRCLLCVFFLFIPPSFELPPPLPASRPRRFATFSFLRSATYFLLDIFLTVLLFNDSFFSLFESSSPLQTAPRTRRFSFPHCPGSSGLTGQLRSPFSFERLVATATIIPPSSGRIKSKIER